MVPGWLALACIQANPHRQAAHVMQLATASPSGDARSRQVARQQIRLSPQCDALLGMKAGGKHVSVWHLPSMLQKFRVTPRTTGLKSNR